MFKSKLFSPLRFHIKALKNKESALDELDENTDLISFAPVILSLSTMVLVVTLLPFFKVATGIIGVLSILSLLYHGAVISMFRFDLSVRNYERIREIEEEEENRRRLERIKRDQEKLEEILRKIKEDRMRKEKQAKENYDKAYHDYTDSYEQEIVDQNMVNAIKLMGLRKGFTKKDLKSSYRKLSKVHHPDMGGSEVNFKKLNTAYNYIMKKI